MRNRMYGGVRGKETKIGRKTFVSLPTRLSVRWFPKAEHAVGKVSYSGPASQYLLYIINSGVSAACCDTLGHLIDKQCERIKK